MIFTTAYSDYALEGYELDALVHLLKPIHFDRFVKAVNKTFQPASLAAPEVKAIAEEKHHEMFVYFKADRKMVKVMLHNILYIESMTDYIKVVTTTVTILTTQSISSVEEMLPAINLFAHIGLSLCRSKKYFPTATS